MTEETEQKQEQQTIILNTKEQVKTLLEAGKLAEITSRYERVKHGTNIYVNQGREQRTNPTLAEYLRRAERKVIIEMASAIIQEASNMIQDDLNNIKELLK